MCALLTEGVKHGQIHPLEGLEYYFWQTCSLHLAVQHLLSIQVVYDLFSHIWHIYACGHLPMSSAVTFVQYDCEDLPTVSSDHVWHHPSVACRYFPLIMYFGASRVPMVTHRERSLVTPAGNTVQNKEEICVHSWRMVSNMVRCTRWKVLSIILDKRAHYTRRYSTCWVSK